MSKVIIYPALRAADGVLLGQHFHVEDHHPHWRPSFERGEGKLLVLGFRDTGAVRVEIEETAKAFAGRSAKRAVLTLDRAAAEAMRDTLNAILGGSSREQRTLIGHPRLNMVVEEPQS